MKKVIENSKFVDSLNSTNMCMKNGPRFYFWKLVGLEYFFSVVIHLIFSIY